MIPACTDCSIVFKRSEIKFLNFGSKLDTIRPLYDFIPSVRKAARLDSSALLAGAQTVPLFQNHGSVLNVDQFGGTIEFSGTTVSQNMVNIPHMHNGPFQSQLRDEYGRQIID